MTKKGEPYYLLSLEHPHDDEDVLTWWGPDDAGRVQSLDLAGKYTRTQIDRRPDFYNNGRSVLAVPCGAAEARTRGAQGPRILGEHLPALRAANVHRFTIDPLKKIHLADPPRGDWLECGHFAPHFQGPIFPAPKNPPKRRRCRKCPRVPRNITLTKT
jgi:hypothetical protein